MSNSSTTVATNPSPGGTDARPPAGSIGWFEVGSADPDRAETFYGELFGWSFKPTPVAGFDYREISTGAAHPLHGGVLATDGKMAPYAVFVVVVDDVAATCAETERLGGRVDLGPLMLDDGLSVAYLSDHEGNRFGVFTPPVGG